MTMLATNEYGWKGDHHSPSNYEHDKHEAAQSLSQSLNVHANQDVDVKSTAYSSGKQSQKQESNVVTGDQSADSSSASNSGGASISEKTTVYDNMQVAPVIGNQSVKEGTSMSLCAPGVLCAGFSHQEESEKYRQMQQTEANCAGLEVVGKQFDRLMAAGLTEMARTYASTHMLAASKSCITTGGGEIEAGPVSQKSIDTGEFVTNEELKKFEQRQIDRVNQLYPEKFKK